MYCNQKIVVVKKYVIFYYLAFDYDKILVSAESLKSAIAIADEFSAKSGAVIVGIISLHLLKMYRYE